MVQVAMQGNGSSIGKTMGLTGAHARMGGPDLGTGTGANLRDRELEARQHFVTPSGDMGGDVDRPGANMLPKPRPDDLPYYYNQYDGAPVPYAAPSALKETMVEREAIRQAAGDAAKRARGGVLRTDPISDAEVAYLKSMKDQTELAKFDEYVETLVDPRMPGNMKWLMEVYPDYVNRRLQQAHTDYEFALRNQMIDSWGINTFDDLHFKYLVDQGKVEGPSLRRDRAPIDSSYTPGWLSPFNFQSPKFDPDRMFYPFASAKTGRRPTDGPDGWSYSRNGRPLGSGNTDEQLAMGMYDVPVPGNRIRNNARPGLAPPPPNAGAGGMFNPLAAR
jgi:hypothetical protein